MGGSLGLALRKRPDSPIVCGYARRTTTRKLALKMGAVDEAFATPQEAVRLADIVVICTPILSIPAIARACAPTLSPAAFVTDVGSTKAQLASQMAALHIPFIGSHPIAGSEASGLESARADLYDGTVVILTPPCGVGRQAMERLSTMWHSVGARTVAIPARQHDTLIAATSHLPHLLASLLVKHVAELNSNQTADLCGGGFRDTTRIAGGSPEMWHDVIITNASAVSRELRKFRTQLDACLRMINQKNFAGIRRLLEKSQRQRQGFLDAQHLK